MSHHQHCSRFVVPSTRKPKSRQTFTLLALILTVLLLGVSSTTTFASASASTWPKNGPLLRNRHVSAELDQHSIGLAKKIYEKTAGVFSSSLKAHKNNKIDDEDDPTIQLLVQFSGTDHTFAHSDNVMMPSTMQAPIHLQSFIGQNTFTLKTKVSQIERYVITVLFHVFLPIISVFITTTIKIWCAKNKHLCESHM